MRYWLIKFAPFRTSWAEIVRVGRFTLRGVRSREACKHLQTMRTGDRVLFYQSQQERSVVGVLEVSRTTYPDPTSSDPQWLTCDFTPVSTLPRSVLLAEIKASAFLRDLPLVRQPRLAVMPMTGQQYAAIMSLSVGTDG